jgi:hypothetical protein
VLLRPSAVLVTADLTSLTLPWIIVKFPDGNGSLRTQSIMIEPRPTRFSGRRWSFVEKDGTRAEILYLVGGLFRSRKSARLTYRSQSAGDMDQLLSKPGKLRARLAGTTTSAPLRGKARLAAAAELERLEEAAALVGSAVAARASAAAQRQRERRKASIERLERARQLIEERQDRTAGWVVKKFKPALDTLKAQMTKRAPRSPTRGVDQATLRAPAGVEVQAETLRRMGYLKPGEIVGAQLGWPRAFIGSAKRRLFFLADLRTQRGCVVFVIQDPGNTETQLFWLRQAAGAFGRREARFACPFTGRSSAALADADGQFVLGAPPPTRKRFETT